MIPGEAECQDLVASLRPNLEEALQLSRFVRHYPLGFARAAWDAQTDPARHRYYFHSSMGTRIAQTEHAHCDETGVELAEDLPFVVAPDGSRLLYLWPLLLQRMAILTGRRTLCVRGHAQRLALSDPGSLRRH